MEEKWLDNKIQCPYNSSHMVAEFRFNTHLVKCRKSYPDLKFKTCNYNVNHKIPAQEVQYHHATCPSRHWFVVPPTEEERTVAGRYPIHNIDVSADQLWDNENVPTYNPQEYCKENGVLIRLDIAPPATKKQFRFTQRQKLNNLEYKQHCERKEAPTRTSKPPKTQPSLFTVVNGNQRLSTVRSALEIPTILRSAWEVQSSVIRPADENKPSIDDDDKINNNNNGEKRIKLDSKSTKEKLQTSNSQPLVPMMAKMSLVDNEADSGFTVVQRKGKKRKHKID